MKDAVLNWELPTERDSGGPLPVDEIAGCDVYISADEGVNWTHAGTVAPADPQTWTFVDLDYGTWMFRVIVVDTGGRVSDPADISDTVPDESNPQTVANLTVTLS